LSFKFALHIKHLDQIIATFGHYDIFSITGEGMACHLREMSEEVLEIRKLDNVNQRILQFLILYDNIIISLSSPIEPSLPRRTQQKGAFGSRASRRTLPTQGPSCHS
jgi:hypothetical protein